MIPAIRVRVQLDDSAFQQGLKQIGTSLGSNVASWNQALELGKKAFEAVDKAMKGVATAVELAATKSRLLQREMQETQRATDQLVKAFAVSAEKSGALRGGIDAVQESLRSLAAWMAGPQGTNSINDFFKAMATGAGIAALSLGAVLDLGRQMRVVFNEVILAIPPTIGVKLGITSEDIKKAMVEPKGSDISTILFDLYQAMMQAAKGGVVAGPGKDAKDLKFKPTPAKTGNLPASLGGFSLQGGFQPGREVLPDQNTFLEAANQAPGLEQANKALQDQVDRNKEITAAFTQNMAGFYAGLAGQIFSGTTSVLGGLAKFVGGMVTQLGTMLIQLGTAAVFAGTVLPLIGTIAGVPAGLAAIAAGTAMVGIGSVISSAGSGSNGAGRAAPGPTPRQNNGNAGLPGRGAPLGEPMRPRLLGEESSGTYVTVNFNGVVGDERRAARMIADLLRENDRLQPRWGS